ncbi:hypothetical protein NKG94_27045 [Micromonospora sp. M12]
MGSIGATVYRNQIAELLPAGLPGDAAESARRASPGVRRGRGLSAGVAGQLRDAAAVAFTDGLNTAAFVGAVLFLILAVVAVVALRDAQMPEGGPGTVRSRTTSRPWRRSPSTVTPRRSR